MQSHHIFCKTFFLALYRGYLTVRANLTHLDDLLLRVPHGEVGDPRAGVAVPLDQPLEDAAQLRPGEAERQARQVLRIRSTRTCDGS